MIDNKKEERQQPTEPVITAATRALLLEFQQAYDPDLMDGVLRNVLTAILQVEAFKIELGPQEQPAKAPVITEKLQRTIVTIQEAYEAHTASHMLQELLNRALQAEAFNNEDKRTAFILFVEDAIQLFDQIAMGCDTLSDLAA